MYGWKMYVIWTLSLNRTFLCMNSTCWAAPCCCWRCTRCSPCSHVWTDKPGGVDQSVVSPPDAWGEGEGACRQVRDGWLHASCISGDLLPDWSGLFHPILLHRYWPRERIGVKYFWDKLFCFTFWNIFSIWDWTAVRASSKDFSLFNFLNSLTSLSFLEGM